MTRTLTRRSLLGAAAAVRVRAAARRPNILVFLADQETALLPGPARLPNRDRLRKNGVEFTRAFCNTPQCSPARAALLTAIDPHKAGVLTNVDGSSLGKELSPKTPNLGSVMAREGYSTGYFGKWHLTVDAKNLSRFGWSTTGTARGDMEIAREAAGWVGKQKGPWLAFVSVINPHDIYEIPRIVRDVKPRPGVKPPSSDVKNLAGKPAEQQQYVDNDQGKLTRNFTPEDWVRYRSHYLDLVEKVDACLGAALGAVKEPDNTVIVYTSDHGDALGEHGLPFKGPFMYEELLRIPLVIAGPGHSGLSPRRNELVVQSDLAPTLTGLAGINWPAKAAGLDLSDAGPVRTAVFLEYYAKQKWVNPIRTVRTRKWKLNWYDRGNKEFYDLEKDPRELRNLAGDAALKTTQQQLERMLDGWRKPLLPARA